MGFQSNNDDTMYKLSIIIPIYNSEKELPSTLDSIINQTMNFNEIEVIMVNDGSTDKSEAIMEKYSKKYDNFISVHLDKNNGSPAKPRNIGIKYATSEYIMFQDSDDIYTTTACEYLYEIIQEENVDIVGGLLTVKDEKNNDVIRFDSLVNILDQSNDEFSIKKQRIHNLITSKTLHKIKFNSTYDNELLLKDSWFTSKIFKKSFIEKNNITFAEGLNGGEDAVFLFNSLLNANGIIYINKVISHYNTSNNNSLTHDKSFKTIESRIKAYNIMLNISQENNVEEIFVKNLLHIKLHYWFYTHLFSSSSLKLNQIVDVLKLGKHLFEKCIEYNVKTQNYLLDIYSLIVNNKFGLAIKKINEKMKSPKVLISIIIPVFNVEEYLQKSLESILNQNFGFNNLEIIFIDDCSTDNSLNIIKEFSKKYKNIKYYSTENNTGFAGKPRNIGIENANGVYLMFLDPDDVFLENACDILFENILNSDLDMVSANFNINRNSKISRNNWNILGLKDTQFKKVETITEFYKFLMPPASVWAKIFKKEFIIKNNIKFLEGVPAQDLVFVCNSLLYAKGIKFINTPVVEYIPREKGNNKSTTSKRDKNVLSGFIKSYTELYYLFLNYNKEYTWLATRNLFFWLKQFMISNLNIHDKIDLLHYAEPLLTDFINSDRLNPPKGLEKFFEFVDEKKYFEAAKLSYNLGIYYEDNVKNIIKNKSILLICTNINFRLTEHMEQIFKHANMLDKHGFKVTLINFDPMKNYDKIINNFKQNKQLNKTISFINIFEYYSKKNNITKIINNEFNIKTNKNTQKISYEDNSIFIEYYNPSNTIKNLIKREMYIDNICYYKVNFNDSNHPLQETYYTNDGYEYLILNYKEDIITLKDRNLGLNIYFKDINEFYKYFLEEILLNLEERPFLINESCETLDSLNYIHPDLAYIIYYIDEQFISNNIVPSKYLIHPNFIITNNETSESNIKNLNITPLGIISDYHSFEKILKEVYIIDEKKKIKLNYNYPTIEHHKYKSINENLTTKYKQLNETNENLTTKCKQLNETNENLTTKYKNLKKELNKLNKENFQLKDKVYLLKNQIIYFNKKSNNNTNQNKIKKKIKYYLNKKK